MLKGISAAVPADIETVASIHPDPDRFTKSTGVYQRHVSKGQTTGDLCYAASRQLMDSLLWDDVDILVMITQTPDYIIPSTGQVIKKRLGLNENCIVLDLNMGCAGWVYGMYIIERLVKYRGLLLVGDTLTRICDKNDMSTYPLFGDAGTATAVEKGMNHTFHLGSDWSDAINIKRGMKEPGASPYFNMDGSKVFMFAINKATECIKKFTNNIESYYLHQANMLVIQAIEKRFGITTYHSISEYGNTSIASLPLTMNLHPPKGVTFACGFGSGLSWGATVFKGDIVTPKIQMI